MADRSFLGWPFFDDEHRRLAGELDEWAARELGNLAHADDLDDACRAIAGRLGRAGWLRHAVPRAFGGSRESLDVRSLCLIRETLARHAPLADFVFALQGLGAGPVTLYGTDEQRRALLPGIADGTRIAAFALSERDAGSDVAAMRTTARRVDGGYVIDGEKTWISNAGIADHYMVFCRFPEAGERAYAAFGVEASNPGLQVTERLDTLAPHPLGTIALRSCRVDAGALVGEPGRGLRVALGTLDVFRAARSTKPSRTRNRARRSAARSPISSWCRPAWPTWPWTSTPARCWSIAPHGPATGARNASPARPPWPSSTPPRPRSA
jgi:acyl-CoA dehydrogenase